MIRFDFRPTSRVDEIWTALFRIYESIKFGGAEVFPIATQTIGTSSTSIRHGMRSAPRYVWAIPHADARIFVPTSGGLPVRPNDTFVFLQANTSVAADVFVMP